MKKLILTCLLSLSSLAMANLGTPLTVVKDLIRSANQRQIAGVNLEKVGMTAEQIVALFNDVDADKAVFVNWTGKENVHWMADENDPKLYHLRMANPSCIGFDVRFVAAEGHGCGGYYEVVKIQL